MEKQVETMNQLQTLQASEIRYRRLFETAQDGILILNAETGEIDDVNPYMVDMLHYSALEFTGMKLWEVSPFKDTVLNRAAFEELQDKGYIRYKDLPLETKEGRPVAVEFVSNVYKANGNKVIQCNIRNITERKEATQKLQEAVIFQQRLIDALPVPVFYKDFEGRYLGCNSSFEKLFGRKREKVTDKSAYELVSKESADIYHQKDRALLESGGIQIYESTVKDISGVAHNVIFHKATFPRMDGSVGGLIGAILDITDIKRAGEALHNSEGHLHTLVQTIPDLIWLKDKEGIYLSCNKMFERFFGFKESHIIGKTDYDFVDRELADSFRENDRNVMLAEGPTSNEEWITFADDGHRACLETIKTPMHDSQGTLTGVLGIGRDITARKRAEEELLWKTAFLEAQTEAAIDGILVVDDKNKILLRNQHFLDIFQVPQHIRDDKEDAPLLQYVASIIKYPEQFLEKVKYLYEHPNETSMDEVELKDGMILDRYSSPVLGENGKYFGRIWTFRDITARKRTVERIRKALGATVRAIATTVETRDPYTAGHQRRVADLACAIATEMNLSVDQIDGIRMAATIHDLGKISVPAEILSKPGKLTNIEFILIKNHSQSGYDILKDIDFPWPVARTVLEHHERMNGSGYPNGLAGDNLLLESRILAVADVVEAMASHRPYRAGLGIDEALNEIEKNSGANYDPTVANACLRLFREKGFQLTGA